MPLIDEEELEKQPDSIPEDWFTAVPSPDGQRRFELHIPDEWLPEGEDMEVFQRHAQWLLDKMTAEEAEDFVRELEEALKPVLSELRASQARRQADSEAGPGLGDQLRHQG